MMGSFNVRCAVSNRIVISNEKVVVVVGIKGVVPRRLIKSK